MSSNKQSWIWKTAQQLGWTLAVGCFVIVAADPSTALAQRRGGGNGGGNRGGGGGGVQVGGGGGGGVRVAAPNAGGGGQVRAAAPSGGGAQVHVPSASGGAQVHVPGASGGAQGHVPGVSGGAQVNTPGVNGQGTIHTPGVNAGAPIPQVNAGAGVGANAGARLNANPTLSGNAAAGLNAAGVNAATGAQAHTALRPTFGTSGAANANVGMNAANNFRANWHNAQGAQLQGVHTGLSSALKANTTTLNANTAATAGANVNGSANVAGFRNPARANYWSNLGGGVTNSFLFGNPYGANAYRGGYYGGNPYFGGNFFSGRNLIGLGVASALGGGYGVGGGYGGGYGAGYGGMGNWWGYSPWAGTNPYGYWYGNTGWNNFAGNYGQPYFYDYGPNGNIAYQGNQVVVNDQPVGTASDYAQSAAELATVTQDQMQAPHDWVPLGTFSVATSTEDKNPTRVAQIAYDNKQGLISGTIFNRQSNNLYTLQGKVDPQTQRVAFTIGNDPNAVFETGLYNLTQNATPVLLHQGPSQTQTWVFARLPEPKEEQAAATAAVPQQPTPVAAPSAEDLRRE